MNEEFLTIPEFAELVGVTPQAVYRRLEKDLSQFVKVIQGKKHLSTEAKSLFKPVQVAKRDNQPVEYLLSQLAEKEREIEQQRAILDSQRQQIEVLQGHIMEQSKELTELLKKQNQLQENFQVLLKGNQEANNACQVIEQGSETQEKTTPEEAPEPVKRSLLKRLFGC